MATNNAINEKRPTGFFAYLSASIPGVTGNTNYYYPVFDTVTLNDGGYNASTGIYTAQASGRYLFQSAIEVNSIDSTNTLIQYVYAVNSSLTLVSFLNALNASYSGTMAVPFSVIVQLSAGGTIQSGVLVFGSGLNVGVSGSNVSPYITWQSCSFLG